MTQLARTLDREEVDRAPGPRGRIVVDVPEAWVAAGDALEVTVPVRMTCARCDGGGCDECARSGAIRLAMDDRARTVSFSLPATAAGRTVVRLVCPLGAGAGLDQLWIELRSATQASPFVKRIPRGGSRALALVRAAAFVGILLALALALAIALGRR